MTDTSSPTSAPASPSDFESEKERSLMKLVLGWLLFPLSLFPLVALLTYDWRAIGALRAPQLESTNWVGPLGDTFAYYGYALFGLGIWVLPVASAIWGAKLVAGRRLRPSAKSLWLILVAASAAALLELIQPHAPGIGAMLERINIPFAGGAVGYLLATRFLEPLISPVASTAVFLILFIIGAIGTIGPGAIAEFFRAIRCWVERSGSVDRDSAIAEEPETVEISPVEETIAADDSSADPSSGQESETGWFAKFRARREEARLRREAEKARREAEFAKRQAEKEAALAAKREAAARELAAIKAAKDAALAAREAERRGEAAQPASAKTDLAPARIAPEDIVADVPASAEPEAAEEEEPDKGPYLLPDVSLLAPLKASVADHSDLEPTSRRLIDTLKLFGIEATLSYTIQGPVVTKYAILLAPGIRYSAVTNLQDNLKGALRAKSLRIEAPIPGEEAVGIEVPNARPAGISFREIFESDAWKNAKAELPLLFGKRADGKELVADLASMPHMLVAGATGQGKSVCLNSLICGLLMTRTPDQLKLIMVDPKCVEFTPYAAIPHLLVPVITDNRKVVFALHWAVAEMEKRLKMFSRARVRNIYDFNHRKSVTQMDMFGDDAEMNADLPKTVPYIVVIIDEAADLIGQCGKEVNPDIQRITQKARAAGIHLILATQRPDAKIITGTIKANIPGRVAFKTSSSVDSRTILDDTGAENLIGKGDMLFRGKDNLLIRAQGAWISDEEIAAVTGFIEEHSNLQYDDKFATKLGRVKEAEIGDPFASNEDDPDNQPKEEETSPAEARATVKAAEDADLFKKAIEVIINTNRASVSHFQRKLGIGYNHSAKLCDELEDRGVIAPQAGAGPRTILLDQQQLLAIFNGGDVASASEPEPVPEPEPLPDDIVTDAVPSDDSAFLAATSDT